MPTWETLEPFVRGKIQETLQAVLDEELTAFLGRGRSERRPAVDGGGYRNGHAKARRLALSCGTVEVRRPRARNVEERFESRVLPLFKRHSQEVAALLPELYLHGLSKGDFELALRGLLGSSAPLSPASIERLRGKWQADYEAWVGRSLADRELVYAWADGVYVKAGLEREKACLLVVIGAMSDGTKEVLAVVPGYRESKESWHGVLADLRDRGLEAPRLLVADGIAGLWSAAAEVWPEAAEQRCWNHIAGRSPRFQRSETSPPGQIPMSPVVWGQAWRGNRPRRSRPDTLASEPSPEARTKPRAAPQGNAFGAVNASRTGIAGRVREWGGRAACVTAKTAATVDAWGEEAVANSGV
jgi:transposase-like protein